MNLKKPLINTGVKDIMLLSGKDLRTLLTIMVANPEFFKVFFFFSFYNDLRDFFVWQETKSFSMLILSNSPSQFYVKSFPKHPIKTKYVQCTVKLSEIYELGNKDLG